MSNNFYERTFLSAGGRGYQAPASRQFSTEEVVRQLRACQDELAHSITTLQQIAQEQERTEQHYERLAMVVTRLIKLVEQPVAGFVLTERWISERDQAVMALREMLGEVLPQNQRTEVEMTPFQTQFQAAMHALMSSLDALPALRYFRAAYEYRRNFPWLHESTEMPDVIGQTGLSYALQTALVAYSELDPVALEVSSAAIPAATGEDLAESIQVDAAWSAELTAAVAATVREHFNLQRFEKHLTRVWISSDVETLKQHIAAAFISYHRRCEIGIVPDPWDLML